MGKSIPFAQAARIGVIGSLVHQRAISAENSGAADCRTASSPAEIERADQPSPMNGTAVNSAP